MTEPRVFNGSTDPEQPDFFNRPDLAPQPSAPEPPPISSLDMLRQAMDAREQAPIPEDVRVPVPGLGIRLVCSPAFSYPQYRDWQKAGLPASQRKGKQQPNGIDMDRTITALLVLVNSCEGIEMETAPDTWTPMVDSNGTPYTLTHAEFLSRFNMIDPKSMLRKLFTPPGRAPDAALIKAADVVIDAAGYGNTEDGEEDPNS